MKFKDLFTKDDSHIAGQIRAATNIALSDPEKERMRVHLSEYAKLRPIRTAQAAPRYAPQNRFFAFVNMHAMPMMAAVLMLAVGGGTAAAAERALPGDILYPIKVHVNEEVAATLATTPKAKADWQVARAERRLEEAAMLSVAGKLDDDARAQIDTNLDEHMKSAAESRAELGGGNDEDAVEVETNISAIAIARENIFKGARSDERVAEARGKVDTATVAAMAPPIPDARAAASVSLMSATDVAVETEPDKAVSKGERTAAKARIEAAKKYLENSRNKLRGETREEVKLRLKAATEEISSGDADTTKGSTTEAASHFNTALEVATQVEVLISASNERGEDDGWRERSADDRKNDSLEQKVNIDIGL